jgi:hypothetical protein
VSGQDFFVTVASYALPLFQNPAFPGPTAATVKVNHKTTPLHMEMLEEGSKHSGDGRDSLTEDNIELVNTKLQQIAAFRERDESDLDSFVGPKINVSEDGPEEATDKKAKEETGNAYKYDNHIRSCWFCIDLVADEMAAANTKTAFKIREEKLSKY